MQIFFLSGSRTPQCLSRSHSLSEDKDISGCHSSTHTFIHGETESLVNSRLHLNPSSPLKASAPTQVTVTFSLLTGGHFVVRSWDPGGACHCWGLSSIFPLHGGPVGGSRPAGRSAPVRPRWISEGRRRRYERRIQRRRGFENRRVGVAAVGQLLMGGVSRGKKRG